MLQVGKAVSTQNIRHYVSNGWLEYKAEKGKNMVFLYLGQEPTDNSQDIIPDEALKKMGWQLSTE